MQPALLQTRSLNIGAMCATFVCATSASSLRAAGNRSHLLCGSGPSGKSVRSGLRAKAVCPAGEEDGLRGGDILALGALSSCSTFFLGLSPSSAVSIADMGGGVGAVGSASGVGGYVNDIFLGVNEGSYRTFWTALSRIERRSS